MDLRRASFSAEELVFAAVSGDPLAKTSLARLCSAISARTRAEVTPLLVDSYGVLSEHIAEGSVQIAWGPPLVVEALTRRRLVSVMCCPHRKGGFTYHSALFSRASRPIRNVDELQGLRAAWVDPSSLSGCVLARRWCERAGRDPSLLFSVQQYLKTHSAVARAVLAGDADVGATYANVDRNSRKVLDAGWSEIGASAGDVHVIATIGPVPSDAIVISARVPDVIRDEAAAALCSLTGPALASVRALFRADRFEPPGPDYLRALGELSGP